MDHSGVAYPRRWAAWHTLEETAVRAFYYTSVQGDYPKVEDIEKNLRALRFDPVVFKKPQGESAKGVDISLTTDMLVHAFLDNYDVAVLVSGDGDFTPVVEEVKRRGKRVVVAAFADTANGRLQLASDHFFDISIPFVDTWGQAHEYIKKL